MATATMTTVTRPSEDALIGIDRALSYYERELSSVKGWGGDLETCLRSAQTWLMAIQSEIQKDDIANDR